MTSEHEGEILDKVRETHLLLVGVPGQKNTGFIERTENRFEEHDETFEDHNKRLRRIEDRVLKATAVVGTLWIIFETAMHWKGH